MVALIAAMMMCLMVQGQALNDSLIPADAPTRSQKTRCRSHCLDISIRYAFNAQKNKYKGTGAGKAERERMSNSN